MLNPRKNKVLMAVMVSDNAGLEQHLKSGQNPNLPGPSKMMPLHMAALMCNETAVALLLAHGAQMEARDKNDLTPLGYAVLPVRETPLQPLKAALKDPEKEAAMNQARANIRKALLAAGADFHAKSAKAPTPFERFEHYWPEQAKAILPTPGPVA